MTVSSHEEAGRPLLFIPRTPSCSPPSLSAPEPLATCETPELKQTPQPYLSCHEQAPETPQLFEVKHVFPPPGFDAGPVSPLQGAARPRLNLDNTISQSMADNMTYQNVWRAAAHYTEEKPGVFWRPEHLDWFPTRQEQEELKIHLEDLRKGSLERVQNPSASCLQPLSNSSLFRRRQRKLGGEDSVDNGTPNQNKSRLS